MLVIFCTHILKAHREGRKKLFTKRQHQALFQKGPAGGDNEVIKKKEEEEDGSGRYIHETVMSGKNKPVKIRSYNSSKKYGVAAKHIKELLDKGCKLLKVRPVSNRFRRPFNRAVVKVVS